MNLLLLAHATPTPEETPGDPLASLLVIGGMVLLCIASMWSLSRKQKKAETRQNEHLNRVEEGIATISQQLARIADALEQRNDQTGSHRPNALHANGSRGDGYNGL